MTPHPLVAALLAIAALGASLAFDDAHAAAGPTASPADRASATGDDDALALPWDLVECHYVLATVFVPTSKIAPYVPEGFHPSVPRGALAESLPESVAQMGFEADDCRSGAAAEGRVSPMQYASIWVGAQPPPHLRVSGYDPYVNFDVLVPDADRRALLQDAGLPARDGSITLTRTGPGIPTPDVEHVAIDLDGFGTITIDAIGPRESSSPFGGRFLQYTQADDGRLALWKTAYAATESYTDAGVVSFPADSWLADVFGASTLPARVLVGEWSYTEGSIAFPVS